MPNPARLKQTQDAVVNWRYGVATRPINVCIVLTYYIGALSELFTHI